MKICQKVEIFIYSIIITFCSCGFLLLRDSLAYLWGIVPLICFICVFSGIIIKTHKKRLKICNHGIIALCSFLCSSVLTVIYHIALSFETIPQDWKIWLYSAVYAICIEAIIFWNGIISVYVSSVQLGIKIRVIGALCGMIPVVNLIVLSKIIKTVIDEVDFEIYREKIDIERKNQKVCKTKYPILLVHGVFFRDSGLLNYWGRIPEALELNGSEIYYGNHQSAASVEESARELNARIKAVCEFAGCEKLNIIAHSKGGLDCRYILSKLDGSKNIASLTTVNSPHKGCQFADYLLTKMTENMKNKIADTYNSVLKRLGDHKPDFISAVNDLTAEKCIQRDKLLGEPPKEIFCQSIGSIQKKARGGTFPLNLTYHLPKYFDGDNDGLVAETSFKWGEKYTLLTTKGKRGISHGDVVDLNRENIKGFDVREFYVELVKDLKDRGL